ncbi:(Na+)-NQR maturation NqrM [Aliikangiella marina]|uniref:(Na+)-NQR maturation NqrM n=1 Tax=Aliikangiella marina TaxID=1712262 RepID=A0A545TBR8_9GAMM|nr:(Na+)-NQR maturation NqrM [Aliikangiella marina]TQV74665.1 (Na+)-NQR maturation NqrM [Aliikangiella marina]
MIEVIFVTFLIMLTVIFIMAIGYIVQRKKIKGSCGGIADLGLEKVCDCEEPCDKRKELLKRLEEQTREEKKLRENQIQVTTLEP